jgi:3-phosphoshikimate 1-carboxyvinyltransferase
MINNGMIRLRPPVGKKISGTVRIPPSKSETNRALVIGAIDEEPFSIFNYSESADSRVVLQFLRQIGIHYHFEEDRCIIIGSIADSTTDLTEVWLDKAGTALRFLTPLCAFLNGDTILRGSEQLSRRPLQALVESLRAVGVVIEYLETEGQLPIKVYGNKTSRIEENSIKLDVSKTSQMLSGLMLIAPLLPDHTRLYFDATKMVSKSYVELTDHLLKGVGISWRRNASCLELVKKSFDRHEIYVNADWSSASYWLALASTIPADLFLDNLIFETLQGDERQVELFREFGLQITETDTGIHLLNLGLAKIKPFDWDFGEMPDTAQTFAVLATFAESQCRLFNLHTLVHKETNRLTALQKELSQLGAKIKATEDGLTIIPQPLQQKQPINTYEDHRMALSFSILVNQLPEVTIMNPNVVDKSYPNYWNDLASVGYQIEELTT